MELKLAEPHLVEVKRHSCVHVDDFVFVQNVAVAILIEEYLCIQVALKLRVLLLLQQVVPHYERLFSFYFDFDDNVVVFVLFVFKGLRVNAHLLNLTVIPRVHLEFDRLESDDFGEEIVEGGVVDFGFGP